MRTVRVNLNEVKDIKDFCRISQLYDCDINLGSGQRIIDGKSIMGLFSLDLSLPVEVTIICSNEKVVDAYIEDISAFIAH